MRLSQHLLFPLLLATAAAQPLAPITAKPLQRADISTSVGIIKNATYIPIGGSDDSYVVSGTQAFNGWFLSVDTLTFKPGAQLVFSAQALNARNSYFIVARRIVVEDPTQPGVITWTKGDTASSPSVSGQAGSGNPGGDRSGDVGGRGADGSKGVDGERGTASPNFTLFVLSAPTGGVTIDFSGSKGSVGGQGMRGGDGGKGGSGHPASQSAFDCRRGAGNGGPGGPGGIGGPGGAGGTGGTGGTVTIVTTPGLAPTMLQRFRLDVSGGPGGDGGPGGAGGNGGQGGSGGQEARPYCRGNGGTGPTGPAGSAGSTGTAGGPGTPGDVFVGSLTEAEFNQYIFQK